MEVGAEVERVFRITNGRRTIEQIALAAGLRQPETARLLDSLAVMGAVRPAMLPEAMARALASRTESGACRRPG
jgi:hypothetical protein